MACRAPRLLICDEATSALDTATEQGIMASLNVSSPELPQRLSCLCPDPPSAPPLMVFGPPPPWRNLQFHKHPPPPPPPRTLSAPLPPSQAPSRPTSRTPLCCRPSLAESLFVHSDYPWLGSTSLRSLPSPSGGHAMHTCQTYAAAQVARHPSAIPVAQTC